MKTFSNKLAITTSSMGYDPAQTLDTKVHAAAKHGYEGMEICYVDLAVYSQVRGIPITTGAEQIRKLCQDNNITILSLCPFENYEGNKTPLADRLRKAEHWIDVARKLGALHLQIPSQFDPSSNGREDLIISELQQLADVASAAEPVVKIAYEPLSWGLYCSTWETALRYVQRVARPNFGLCLDTFHELTKLWGNALDPSGRYPDGDAALASSLHRFLAECPVDKIFYVQLSDGELLSPPISDIHPWFVDGEAPEFTWSKHARPFPLETEYGGYLPVAEVLRAWVVDKKFAGWVSMEIFDRRMRNPAFQPEEGAARGQKSWQKLAEAVPGVRSHL